MTKKIAVLPGDGIGTEIVAEALKVLDFLNADMALGFEFEHGLIGGAAYDVYGTPFPQETIDLVTPADAILLGAVGGYKWESLDISVRPEKVCSVCVQRWVYFQIYALPFYIHNSRQLRP